MHSLYQKAALPARSQRSGSNKSMSLHFLPSRASLIDIFDKAIKAGCANQFYCHLREAGKQACKVNTSA